jgi:hypothetical protein
MKNGKKLSYFDFISSLQNEECNRALKKIVGRVNMEEINKLIEDTPAITPMQSDFYKTMIAERKEKILDYSMELLMKQGTKQADKEKSLELGQDISM